MLIRDCFEADGGAIVEFDVSEVSFRHFNLFNGVEVRNVIGHVKGDFVLFDIAIRPHGLIVVVEGHTRADDVDKSEAFVRHCSLEQ